MRDFFEELFDMCSANNTKSRGLYIFITVAMAVLALGVIASLILLIVNVVKFGAFSPMWLILLIVMLVILIGIIVWLKKS